MGNNITTPDKRALQAKTNFFDELAIFSTTMLGHTASRKYFSRSIIVLSQIHMRLVHQFTTSTYFDLITRYCLVFPSKRRNILWYISVFL